jgi:bacillopeptidase F (M6 metalloprotease family)
VPTDIQGGRYAIWGNREDESVALMTREFDLSGVTSAELAFDAWYSIEQDYDYAYVEISADGGSTWQILQAPGTTDTNPTGANFGWGYTGESDGWRRETIDLTPFAGQPVFIRFEYITDAALNFPGILVDNVEIAALDYREDFEGESAGWEFTGMARIDNQLPQEFLVQVITQDGDTVSVERMAVSAGRGRLPVTVSQGQIVTVTVSGITPFTTEPAEYTLSLE